MSVLDSNNTIKEDNAIKSLDNFVKPESSLYKKNDTQVLIYEQKPFNPSFPRGCISLDKLAYPNTVKVKLLGKRIYPISFNLFGEPIFTNEQRDLYMYKEVEIRRERNACFTLNAEITYVERKFDVERDSFDSIDGIKASLVSLKKFHEMLQNRIIYRKLHENERLNEFMVFGIYCLDWLGDYWSLDINEVTTALTVDVEDFYTFCSYCDNFRGMGEGYCIPRPNDVCPYCSKKFTISDLKNNPCIKKKNKTCHESCSNNFEKLQSIHYILNNMDKIYGRDNYKSNIISDDLENSDGCKYKSQFLFNTPDGDIKITYGEIKIFIEWQENYKPFNLSIFKRDDVEKTRNKKKRGILIDKTYDIYTYLRTVKDFVDNDINNKN